MDPNSLDKAEAMAYQTGAPARWEMPFLYLTFASSVASDTFGQFAWLTATALITAVAISLALRIRRTGTITFPWSSSPRTLNKDSNYSFIILALITTAIALIFLIIFLATGEHIASTTMALLIALAASFLNLSRSPSLSEN